MRYTHIVAAATFMLTSSVASAITAPTIWAPTNQDTDFIELDFGTDPDISTNGGTLALFDDSDFGGVALEIGENGGHVVFTDNMDGSWNAEVFDETNTSGGSITLSNNTHFVLGIDWGLGYFGDTNSMIISSPDTYLIVFDGLNALEQPVSGNTLAVDLAPIPVPAAVWLFGTGLLGLVAVMRRHT